MFSGEYLRRKFAHRQFKVWCFAHRGLRSKDVAKLKGVGNIEYGDIENGGKKQGHRKKVGN